MPPESPPSSPTLVAPSACHNLVVRPLGPDDAALLAEFFSRLSDRSYLLRFGRPAPADRAQVVRREVERLTSPCNPPRAVLLATDGLPSALRGVAVAELAPDGRCPCHAEAAIVVLDELQRMGVGTAVACCLMRLARQRDITNLSADILAENVAVLRLMRRLGLVYRADTRRGETHITAWVAGAR